MTRERTYTRERRKLAKVFSAAIERVSKLIASDDPAVALRAVDKLSQLHAKLAKLQTTDTPAPKDDSDEPFDEAELTAEIERRELSEPTKNLIQSTAGNALEDAGRVDTPVAAPLTPSYCEYSGCSESAPLSLNGGFYCRTHYVRLIDEVGAGPVDLSDAPDLDALIRQSKEEQQKSRYLQRYDSLKRQIVPVDLDKFDPYSVPSTPVSQAAFNPLNGGQLLSSKTFSQEDGWRSIDVYTGKVGESDRERMIRMIQEGGSK